MKFELCTPGLDNLKNVRINFRMKLPWKFKEYFNATESGWKNLDTNTLMKLASRVNFTNQLAQRTNTLVPVVWRKMCYSVRFTNKISPNFKNIQN